MKYSPPGLLRAGVNPDVIMMICTAGHVDHGKTSLVKLLTGCNTDRLKVEQERGLTIELGFAPCFLGGNLCVGIVDVPGHEKFIRNMVAGVSGIEMTVLVVAADDGVMPQTVEHFQIMELLGVRHGMVALTKIDLVAEERVAEVRVEIAGFLKGTFMDGAPICPLSSETLDGYFEFYKTLVENIKSLAGRRRRGVFRMPIERVFSREGFGAVLSGIPVDGAVRLGDQVEVVPGNQTGRVRGIQRFLREADVGSFGQCLALNVSDLSKRPPLRGQVLCAPGYLKAATAFHLRVKAVGALEKPLQNAESIKFHTGTSEETGKLYLLEGKTLGEGAAGLATVVLSSPVAAAVHDRFIVRRLSPAVTIAGGEILAVAEDGQRPRKKEMAERLAAYCAMLEGVDPFSDEGLTRRLEYFLLVTRPAGAAPAEISRGTLLPIEGVKEGLARLGAAGKVLALGGDFWVHAEGYRACLATLKARLKQAAENALSLNLADLRKDLAWAPPLWARLREELEEEKLVQARGAKLILREAADTFGGKERELLARLVALYENAKYETPRPDELPALLGAPQEHIDRLIEHLLNEGQLIRIAKNVLLTHNWFQQAQTLVVAIIKEEGVLNSGDFKTHIGSSRKYALAILDTLDARKVTIRIGNDRKLTRDYEKRLA